MKTSNRLAAAALATLCAAAAHAWDNHAQLTYLALLNEPYAAKVIKAESLDAFLQAERAKLPAILSGIEQRAAAQLAAYAPPPAVLALDPNLEGEALRAAFLRAIRVNPGLPLPLYVQLPAGARRQGRKPLAVRDASLIDVKVPNAPFEVLQNGGSTSVMETVMTASDEPDYGLDFGLFEDNGTELGAAYGFGPQPYGNPALVYGSQAPFHMSFPREDPLVKAAAPFVTKGQAAYRILQFENLARFAFAAGHDYWGWRFAGWALHYLQDLAYPYHASVLPGRSAGSLLWFYATSPKKKIDDAVVLLSNRHLLGEHYAYNAVVADPYPESDLARVLAAPEPGIVAEPYRELYAYDVVALRSYSLGRELDRLVASVFDPKWVSDPAFDYGSANIDPLKQVTDPFDALRGKDEGDIPAFRTMVKTLLSLTGVHTRAFASWVHDSSAILPPRKEAFDPRGAVYVGMAVAVLALIVLLVLKLGKKRARPRVRA